MRIFQNHPRRGYHILYLISPILYLRTLRLRRRATARVVRAQRIHNLYDCRWQSYLNVCPYAGECPFGEKKEKNPQFSEKTLLPNGEKSGILCT